MEVANIFNNYFTDGVAAHIPILHENAFTSHLSIAEIHRRFRHLEFSFHHVEVGYVKKLLDSLKPNKATGPDKISPRVLAASSEALADPLTNLMNHLALPQERKVTIKEILCPRNITQCKDVNHSIIHVVAESNDKRSVIHYLWSVIGSPTIIAAYFEKTDVKLTVNWMDILSKRSIDRGIQFTSESDYITAFVIPAIYEFQDPKDELFYTEKNHINNIVKHAFDVEKILWKNPEIDTTNNITTFKGSMLGGTVIFQCNASASEGRESVLPHQKFTSNSTVFTLTLDHLTALKKRGHTRFIIELVSFTVDRSATCVTAELSLDDEHTPAVFKTIVINSTGFSGSSYSAWKPVAYTNNTRSLDHQVPSYAYYGNKHQYIKQSCDALPSTSNPSISSIVFHLKDTVFTSYGMNISFGQQKDGWYDGEGGSHYLTWSAMVGYGSPVFDSFSTVVWIIIFVGFGTPMLLIVITIVYVIVKKIKARKATSSYGMIN
ncbi:hypothetical protein OS493_002545 [Desmophyllum pertusum]|uniref:Uncharacterized protein n=1 Tax=Desmophyllum pertusum TaxID=174260 RepID=A0A9W9YUK1_9CNID|nr:hypothetical protein OS493_002545 [Desmophyllum pertusum]